MNRDEWMMGVSMILASIASAALHEINAELEDKENPPTKGRAAYLEGHRFALFEGLKRIDANRPPGLEEAS